MLPFNFDAPWLLLPGLALALSACVAAWRRRIALTRWSRICAAAGLFLLALAAGAPHLLRPDPRQVAVMVDLSPSTRGAAYRNRDAITHRISQLLGSTPYRIILFAGENHDDPNGAGPLAELATDRTIFSPPPAGAILLFSDGRFDLPAAAPPTYPVIDPALDDVKDAAVRTMELRDADVAIGIDNRGGGRTLTVSGGQSSAPQNIPAGAGPIVILNRVDPSTSSVTARLSPGDLWPENDSASIIPLPPGRSEQWWVGSRSPGPAWRTFSPANLPAAAENYLAPAVIVLDDIDASSLSDLQRQRLSQYVGDLGGALVILGGTHAFAAGGYPGSLIDDLSPLSSTPPEPTMHWMLLADSSGSMSQPIDQSAAGQPTRWELVSAALLKLLRQLPPDDLASAGNFATSLNWWSYGKSVRETLAMPLPPANVSPTGATNLESAINRIAADAEGALPKQLLVLTDAETTINHPDQLAQSLQAKKIHLHVLAIGPKEIGDDLRKIIQTTGGTTARQADAMRWADAAAELMRQAMPRLIERTRARLHFLHDLPLPDRELDLWNRTWLKNEAQRIADADGTPMAARWQRGAGQVIAAAFPASAAEAQTLAALIAASPRDPRLRISWQTAPRLKATIDAINPATHKPINDLALDLEITPAGNSSTPPVVSNIPQTAPGHYELTVPAPRFEVFAAVRRGGQIIDRIAVPARYAPEFDAIGNDREALHQLAAQTGGRVIDVRQTTPIAFDWPDRKIPLGPVFAIAGVIYLAAALILWRL